MAMEGEDLTRVEITPALVDEYRDRWNLGLASFGYSKTKEYLHSLAQPRKLEKAFQFTYVLQGVLGVIVAMSTRTSVYVYAQNQETIDEKRIVTDPHWRALVVSGPSSPQFRQYGPGWLQVERQFRRTRAKYAWRAGSWMALDLHHRLLWRAAVYAA